MKKKGTLSYLLLIAGIFVGGVFVWLWKRLIQISQVASSPRSKPISTTATSPSRAVPTASTADYETWLDWLVNSQRISLATLQVPDVSKYQTWLDPLFKRSRFHWIITSIFFSLLTFLFGLTLALLFNFYQLFISTPAIYLAVIGTSMGVATFYWAGRAFPPAFAALAPYFGVPTEQYAEFIYSRLKTMYSKRAMLTISGGVLIVILGLMVAVFLFPDPTVPFLRKFAPSLVMLEDGWYFGGANLAKMLIIDLYFIINFPLVISGAWLCVQALIILYNLAKLPILPIPTVMTLKLRKIVDIYIVICLVWLVAVSIFVLLFFETIDFLSIIWIGSQAFLTMATFLLPQFLSRRIILNLREQLITATRLAYDKYFEHFDESNMDPQKRLNLLSDLSEEANSIKPWPVEPFDWLLMLAGEALPPITAFIKNNFLDEFLKDLPL